MEILHFQELGGYKSVVTNAVFGVNIMNIVNDNCLYVASDILYLTLY